MGQVRALNEQRPCDKTLPRAEHVWQTLVLIGCLCQLATWSMDTWRKLCTPSVIAKLDRLETIDWRKSEGQTIGLSTGPHYNDTLIITTVPTVAQYWPLNDISQPWATTMNDHLIVFLTDLVVLATLVKSSNNNFDQRAHENNRSPSMTF